MRIAILSLPFRSNYGGILQAFALQTVLQRMGHQVVVLDKDVYHHRSWLRQQISFCAYFVRKYLLQRDCEYYDLRRAEAAHKVAETNTRRFVNSYLNILQVKRLSCDFPRDIDAVVVGSDQVWRPKYFAEGYDCGIEQAYLSFLEGISVIRLSYAASFGTGDWEYSAEETALCSRLIRHFDAVSVREVSAVSLCRGKLGRDDVCLMPDPTLLLSQNDYRMLFSLKEKPRPYLLYYVLDETEEKMMQAGMIAEAKGLSIKRINRDSIDPAKPVRTKEPVEEWLDDFASATFVYTDSFHGCVFSLLFERAFVVMGNASRGMDRFISLLTTFHLENHLILSGGQFDPEADYSVPASAQKYLQEQRRRAFRFLEKYLRG